jgi:predicted extracellular nuclease
VDLTAYTVRLYANGGTAPTTSLPLTGTLEAGKTLLLINASFTTAVTLPGALKTGVVNFNGDDAVTLEKSGTVIDAFGQVGFDPGTAWTGGTLSALDRTLRRKPGIVHGSVPAAAPAAWDLSSEWVGFPIDTFDGLGSHVAQ